MIVCDWAAVDGACPLQIYNCEVHISHGENRVRQSGVRRTGDHAFRMFETGPDQTSRNRRSGPLVVPGRMTGHDSLTPSVGLCLYL